MVKIVFTVVHFRDCRCSAERKTPAFLMILHVLGDIKITSTSTKRQKHSQNLAPVLVIISGNSLVFSRKIITSTGFYWCCTPGASAPVVVKNQSPMFFSPQPRKGKEDEGTKRSGLSYRIRAHPDK